MAQNDMIIDDQDGLSFLADLNAVIASLVSSSSGATEPATMYAYQWWADTTSGWLKQRNAANSAWINKLKLADATSTIGAAILAAADAAAVRALIGAVIGTDVMAYAASASQAEMEAGTEAGLRAMSPLRVAQAIAALGGGSTDSVARDQIALTNLRLMLNSAVTTGALVQGKQWELATDEWAASSTNETYTSATPNYYGVVAGYGSDLAAAATATASAYSGGGFEAAKAIDGNTGTAWYATGAAVDSGTVEWLKLDFGTAKAIRQIQLQYSTVSGLGAAQWPNAWSVEYSDDGSSWSAHATINPAQVSTLQTFAISSGGSHRYWRLKNADASRYVSIGEVKMMELSAPANMTLIPPAAVSVASAPSYMDAYCLWKDDDGSAVLGTDFTIELSRDNGTTYTTATLTNLGSFDGTYSIIKARADVSAQPSGTSMLCRIKTLNTKAQRIAAPALYAE